MIHLDTVFPEPILKFGNKGTSCDIRHGILNYGPLDLHGPKAKTTVKLGFVGTPKTVRAFSDWMKTCSTGVETDDPANQNFNPVFPGLAASVGLRCSFLTDPTWVTELPESELEQICGKTGAVLALADLFHQKIGALYTLTSVKPEVVLCLPPESVRKRVKPRLGDGEEPSEEDENSEPDFHDYLKGLCLHCSP